MGDPLKFSCERCSTRYSISDEKVRGKILKIRCKTCSNIVVVREATLAGQEPGQAQAPSLQAERAASTGGGGTSAPAQTVSPPPSALPELEWFVAIKGKQHGPVGREGVARLFRDGTITDRSYLWHDGMAAWTRLREVPQFASLVQQAAVAVPPPRPPPPRPPPPPQAEESSDAGQGAEIIPFAEARRARDADPFAAVAAHQALGAITNDPFGAVSHDGGEVRESTRVFIMKAGLANRGQKNKTYAGVAAAGVALLSVALYCDYQGLIEIPGLHSVVDGVARTEDTPRLPLEMINWDDAEQDPRIKCKLDPDQAGCMHETVVRNALIRKKQAQRAEAVTAAGPTLNDDDFRLTGPSTGSLLRSGTGVGGMAEISNPEDAQKIRDQIAGGGKKLTAPNAQIDPIAVSGSDIDAASVFKTISQYSGSVQDCVEQGAKIGSVPEGRQVLIIGIEPNGTVSKARFKNGATNASPVGECIRDAAKRWKFQAFPGAAADVEVPLILSVGM